MESRQATEELIPTEVAIQIPINSLWLEVPMDAIASFLEVTGDLLNEMALLWIEPIFDDKGLLNLSIGLLVMERVGSSLQRYESKWMDEVSTNTQISGETMSSESLFWLDTWSWNDLLSPPGVALFGTLAVVFTCVANASHDIQMMIPICLRMYDGSVMFIYILLLLFCLESIMMLAILVFACHALTFWQWMEEDLTILAVLIPTWLLSIMTSSLMRFFLYFSIGD